MTDLTTESGKDNEQICHVERARMAYVRRAYFESENTRQTDIGHLMLE